MARGGVHDGAVTSLPLFPSDDGWPYPDDRDSVRSSPATDDEIDLDLLELRADPHAYSDLTELEYFAVSWRYGLGGDPHSMKDLACSSGATTPRRARRARGRARQAASALLITP